ncbi:MAG: DUF2341 domain-containing protein, partial [Phaeospirillum sp.]|nr:DUF2341 domain-containing protein [Phaeospirillum sp.]
MKTAQRILAVLVILGIAFAAPASVLAQAPPYTVAFTIVRVTPASATVRAVITGPNIPTSMTVAILNYDEVLAGLTPQQATVQVVQKITMTDVVQSTAAKEQHVTETQATTIDDVIAAAPDAATKAELRTLDGKQISAVAKAIKGVAVAKGGGNLTAEEAKLHALSATAKAALDTHPVTKTVQYAKQLAQTAPVQMRDKRTEKTLTNLQSVPLAGGTRTVEFDVQTGKMATWDGKFGSRAVLALIINGTYYYDLTHSSWWNASWLYRKALSFNASSLSATLTDFPVKVSLTSANFDFAQAKSDGTDVRFLGSDDATPLSYEIAYWNQAGQVGTLWVKVPSLTALGNYSQFIYMYHGNAAAADAQDKNATWGSYSTINTADATTNWASTGGAMTITLDNA